MSRVSEGSMFSDIVESLMTKRVLEVGENFQQ